MDIIRASNVGWQPAEESTSPGSHDSAPQQKRTHLPGGDIGGLGGGGEGTGGGGDTPSRGSPRLSSGSAASPISPSGGRDRLSSPTADGWGRWRGDAVAAPTAIFGRRVSATMGTPAGLITGHMALAPVGTWSMSLSPV